MHVRAFKLAEQIHREISSLIQFEMRDPRIRSVTITKVKVNNDLSYAKIYFTSTEDSKIKEIGKSLNHAQGFFRTKLGSRLDLRKVPEVKFYFDDSLVVADRLEEILKNIRGESNKR